MIDFSVARCLPLRVSPVGVLAGRAGAQFHVLQGFWYRYLVDAKIDEVERLVHDYGVDVVTAIHLVLGLKVVGRAK